MVGGNDAAWTPPDFTKYGNVSYYTDMVRAEKRANTARQHRADTAPGMADSPRSCRGRSPPSSRVSRPSFSPGSPGHALYPSRGYSGAGRSTCHRDTAEFGHVGRVQLRSVVCTVPHLPLSVGGQVPQESSLLLIAIRLYLCPCFVTWTGAQPQAQRQRQGRRLRELVLPLHDRHQGPVFRLRSVLPPPTASRVCVA